MGYNMELKEIGMLNCSCREHRPKAGSCGQGCEPLGPIKARNFLTS
jgi:hypothetical protein